jgi:hypothetical protein
MPRPIRTYSKKQTLAIHICYPIRQWLHRPLQGRGLVTVNQRPLRVRSVKNEPYVSAGLCRVPDAVRAQGATCANRRPEGDRKPLCHAVFNPNRLGGGALPWASDRAAARRLRRLSSLCLDDGRHCCIGSGSDRCVNGPKLTLASHARSPTFRPVNYGTGFVPAYRRRDAAGI